MPVFILNVSSMNYNCQRISNYRKLLPLSIAQLQTIFAMLTEGKVTESSPHLANGSLSTKVTTGSSPVKSWQTAPATISATLPANRPTYYAMIYKPLFSMSSPYLQKRPISRLFHCCFFHSVPAR